MNIFNNSNDQQTTHSSMCRVIASHSTAVYSVPVSKSLYGCTSSEKEIPWSTLGFSFYHLEVKLKEKKNTWICHLKEAHVLIHRKAVPELFTAYSYEASFSRRPTGVQKINHFSRHWSIIFLTDRIDLPSSIPACRSWTTNLFMYGESLKDRPKWMMGNPKSTNPNFASFFYTHIFVKQPLLIYAHMFWNKRRNQNPAHPKTPLCCGF